MSQHSKRILLVEGLTDKQFFEGFCRRSGLRRNIQVALPREINPNASNGKDGLLNLLANVLKNLEDGSTEALAAVVDADFCVNQQGFENTLDRVKEIISPAGYVLAEERIGGLIFNHDDGLADFGLWIMPSNGSEGTLEDLLKQCVAPAEPDFFRHALSVVHDLPTPPRFASAHRSKAEVATWLAWQKDPGHDIRRAVADGLLNADAPLYQDLLRWLEHVFKAQAGGE